MVCSLGQLGGTPDHLIFDLDGHLFISSIERFHRLILGQPGPLLNILHFLSILRVVLVQSIYFSLFGLFYAFF